MSNIRQYDELEHEGNENFEFQNRQNEKEIKKKIKDRADQIVEESKEKLQEQWMNLHNPFLWEGDFDA